MLVCQSISCPFFEPSSKKSYGCQRYSSSQVCHLRQDFQLSHNDYALFGSDDTDLTAIEAKNKQFFANDRFLADHLSFLKSNPDLVDCSFVPKPY